MKVQAFVIAACATKLALGFAPLARPPRNCAAVVRIRGLQQMAPQPSSTEAPELNSVDSSDSTAAQKDTSNMSQGEIEAMRLRSMAAKLRAEAAQLEAERATERSEEVQRLFKSLDANSDGVISASELRAGLEKITKRSVAPEASESLLAQLDKNNDGVLQLDELVGAQALSLRLDEVVRAESAAASKARTEAAAAAEQAAQQAALAALVNDKPASGVTRALSTLPYLLPLLDSAVYGRFLLQGPAEGGNPAVVLLLTLLALFRSVPLSQFAAFLGLSFLGDNLSANKIVRHNALQAVYLDVALFPASLLLTLLAAGNNLGIPPQVVELGSDAVFAASFAAILYSVVTTAAGSTPDKLPLISTIVQRRLDRMSAREFMKRQQNGDDPMDRNDKNDRK